MNVVVYGGGGLALEIISYLKDLEAVANTCRFLGIFIPDGFDFRASDIEAIAPDFKVYRTLEDLPTVDTALIIGIGDPLVRFKLTKQLTSLGHKLFTLIHPRAYVAPSAVLEQGVVLAPFAFVGPNAHVKDSAILNTYASVGHDAVVGEGSTLSPYSCLNGNAVTGRACFLGSYASLSPKATIGDGCKVSAGSVYSRAADAGSMIHGNPAKARVMMRVNLDD